MPLEQGVHEELSQTEPLDTPSKSSSSVLIYSRDHLIEDLEP